MQRNCLRKNLSLVQEVVRTIATVIAVVVALLRYEHGM